MCRVLHPRFLSCVPAGDVASVTRRALAPGVRGGLRYQHEAVARDAETPGGRRRELEVNDGGGANGGGVRGAAEVEAEQTRAKGAVEQTVRFEGPA
jgi:hypothetical protein